MTGIIASTNLEADLIISSLMQRQDFLIQKKPFYSGKIKNRRVSICICGVGKSNAAHGTAILIEKFKPDLIYIIGIAGAYPSSELSIGDIAIAKKEIYGDEGLIVESKVKNQESKAKKREEMFYAMDMLGLPLATINGKNYYNQFPMFMPKKIKNQKSKIKIRTGNFVTVSTCTGILERGKEIEKKFNAICENMEGAAIAHVCSLSGIPVTEIRGISNIIEDRTVEPLNKTGIIKAAENSQRFFLETII